MKKVQVHQVDSFTDKIFGGNPAGVVFDADKLTDDEMKNIAREMNLSETAFVLKPTQKGADVKMRYFTCGKAEITFCGHATIGTLYEIGRLGLFGTKNKGSYLLSAIAAAYAAEHKNKIAGLLLIDGAFPISTFTTEEEKEKVRQSFRKMAPFLPLLAFFGKAARMSAEQAANLNLELDKILGDFNKAYDKITCPITFICASKRSVGGTEEQFRRMRESVEPLAARHKNITVETLPCTHLEILSKYPDVVIKAIKDLVISL